jgi:hypothetical protein
MATVVQDASSSTVSENFPPAVLVIFRSSLGLRESGTETATPGASAPPPVSVDFFLSCIDIVRAGSGGGGPLGVDIVVVEVVVVVVVPTRLELFGNLGKQQQEATTTTTEIGQPILCEEVNKGRRPKVF